MLYQIFLERAGFSDGVTGLDEVLLAQIAISLNLKYKPPVTARVQFFAAEKREVQKFHGFHIRLSPCQSGQTFYLCSVP